MNIVSYILIIAGGVFYATGGLGLLRMPSLYTRAQAGTKATTLGTMLTLGGVIAARPEWTLKILLIMLFVIATNPVGSSTLIRSAYRSEVKPHGKPVVDDLNEFYEKEDG